MCRALKQGSLLRRLWAFIRFREIAAELWFIHFREGRTKKRKDEWQRCRSGSLCSLNCRRAIKQKEPPGADGSSSWAKLIRIMLEPFYSEPLISIVRANPCVFRGI